MNVPLSDTSAPLIQIVAFLASRKDGILENWHTACAQDPLLSKVVVLSRAEFNNTLPVVLTILQQRLLGQAEEGSVAQLAVIHGVQRRHNGRLVVETVRELNHLTQALYNELTHFQESVPGSDLKLFWQVQQQMTQIMTEVINEIIQVYDELQRSEAAGQAAILQKAINQMTILSHQRSDRLRTSMHDLRGSVGIIGGAASLLKLEGISEQERTDFLEVLNRNLASVQAMLGNLMDLSRLEAGEETLQIQPIDVAQLLRGIAMSMQPLAEKQKLALRIDGPNSLPVETDPVKLQRITQNLLLNALKYTSTGFIAISWIKQNTEQWVVCIQDSGPGLPISTVELLTNQIKPVINPANRTEPEELESIPVVPRAASEPVANISLGQPTHDFIKGEGIGLRIVKQFSELLGAKLEVETTPDQGTSFSLWLPTRYPAFD